MHLRRVEISGFLILIGVSYLGFVAAKLAIFQIDADRILPDTFSYARVAETDLGESSFWLGERPPSIPLLHKALGLSLATVSDSPYPRRVTTFQLGFAAIAWGLLAGVVAWVSESRLQRAAAVVLILAFAITPDIAYWDRMLLSESVSTSLFALLIAGCILGIRSWGDSPESTRPIKAGTYVAGMTVLIVLFSFTRDVNAYLIGAASLLIVGTILVYRLRGRMVHWVSLALAIIMALTWLLHNHTMAISKRWLGPMLNVVGTRGLSDRDFVAFFQAHGMQADSLTQEMALGRSAFLGQLTSTQGGRHLMEWFELNGRSTYMKYLISRPFKTLGSPVNDLPSLIRPDSSEYRLPQRTDPGWAQILHQLLFPERIRFVAVLVLLPATALVMARKRRWSKPIALPAIALLMLAFPMALVIWHGDAIELERHSYQLALQVRLAGWLLVIAALNRVPIGANILRRRDPGK